MGMMARTAGSLVVVVASVVVVGASVVVVVAGTLVVVVASVVVVVDSTVVEGALVVSEPFPLVPLQAANSRTNTVKAAIRRRRVGRIIRTPVVV